MECNICYNEIGINTNTSCKAKPTHKICTEYKKEERGYVYKSWSYTADRMYNM